MKLVPLRGAQRRIGVAIQVPQPYGPQLQDARARAGDPLARAIPPHVTLLGPTVIQPDEMDDVTVHLRGVAAEQPAFTVLLRGTGTFRPVSPVVFVQVAAGIAECEQLESSIRSGPLKRDLRFSYHPHVTVAHDVPDAAMDRAFGDLAGYEASFGVDRLWLYEHGEDGVWRPIDGFELARSA